MLRIVMTFSAALLAIAACARRADAPPPASEQATVRVPGLGADVRIVTDRWGIPHLHAHTVGDLYFAWGYVTARDRLWQLELTRRAAGGSLWEWFGNRTLTADGGAQLFRLRERAQEIWSRERTDPAIREPLERYAAGINAWIARCRSGEAPWPVEFMKLGKQPADWEPENAYLVLLAQGMLLDLDLPELDEAQEIREHGVARTIARHQYEDDMVYASIPDSTAERLYGRPPRPTLPGRPYTQPTRTGLRLEGGTIDPALLAEARRTLSGWLDPATRDPDERASNIFAVGPGRSASGAPMLANDVHLSLGAPGPFHIVHLTVPGVLDVAGASVPGMPLIVSGRNDRCAWGLTSLAADVIDVYADSLSRDGRQVRWRGSWVPITTQPFTLRYRVLGVVPIAPPGQVRRYTPHGPVVAYDKKRRLAMSVRWAGDDQAITLARLLDMPRARSIADLAAAVRTVVTPTSNIVMADRDGGVAYHVVGALPQRGFEPPPGPIPDDSAHEWLGLIAPDERPHWELGPRDFVVNGNNLPVGAPYHEPFPRYDFMQDRAARMAERLTDDPSMTLADLRSVQNDLYSRGAARFLPLLLRCADSLRTTHDRDVRAALDTLRRWDHVARRDRVAPTLFRAWLGALQRRSRLEGVPMLAAAALSGRSPAALREPGKQTPERAAIAATESFHLALAELEDRLGADRSRWQYARAHQARFRHALAWRDSTLQPPPVPADGDQSTVSVGRSSLPWSALFTHGPVWRHLVDLAVPESSLCVVPPGNAGQGPHARDHLSRWASHGYVPLLLDWRRIEAARETETRLEPGPAGAVAPATGAGR